MISSFSPASAFGGDRVVVYAENVDRLGNQLLFPGGMSVLAQTDPAFDGGQDLRVDGGLSFYVPSELQLSGRLILAATQGRSQPSGQAFTALGVGHPDKGSSVGQLRFRHNPVGIVDRLENVLMASSIFDLIVTDGKAFRRVPGRPLALVPSAIAGRALLSVATEGGGGMFLEVDAADGKVLTRENLSDTREHFILPAANSSSLGRTVGVDAQGRSWLSTWTNQGGVLVASRAPLGLTDLLGAAALGTTLVVVGRAALEPTPAVFSVTAAGVVSRIWAPGSGASCGLPNAPECELPDGPAVVVPSLLPGPPTVVVSLRTGDLLVLEGSPIVQRTIRLISYAPISDLAAALSAGKVLFTKAIDGALFQLDLTSESVDWSVQLRGEPTVIDVNAVIDEIAVGNRLDNAVDVITASTGGWTGRVAFNLGVGSADGAQGGIVAPYSYDPKLIPPGSDGIPRMDLLMRHVGLVVSIDASSLEVLDYVVLEADRGAALRLAVTPWLQTLVIHEHGIGLLEKNAEGAREERLLTAQSITTPIDVVVLPSGDLLCASRDRVSWYRWAGPASARVLELGGELRLPAASLAMAIAADGDQVLVLWRSITTGWYAGGFYRPAELASGTAVHALQFNQDFAEFLGLVPLREGPVALFGRKGIMGGPVVVSNASLRGDLSSVPSVIARSRLGAASPDGRYVVWLDEGAAEPMARLVTADVESGFSGYSTYRLRGNAAGPAFDPSGQWLYLPVPLLDQLDVVQ